MLTLFQLKGPVVTGPSFCVFSAIDGHKNGNRAPIFTLLCLLDVEGIGESDHPCGIGIEVVIRQEGDAAEVDRQIGSPISLLSAPTGMAARA